MLLADLGADVIKIEPPAGDMARRFGPFVGEESAFFMSVNRGKRSVVIDLTTIAGREEVLELVRFSDVVLHNYRTGVAERLGLGYDSLQPTNPGLVYCAISGFGPQGPMAQRPGMDLLFQSESGMLAVTGEPGGSPVKVGTNAADVYTATMASTTIVAALLGRATSGRGSRIDISARDAFLALQACSFSSYLATGHQPERLGSASPFTAPTDVYGTADGSIVLAVINEKHWRILVATLELEINNDDVRFADNQARVANSAVLRSLVESALARQGTSAWLKVFEQAGIPAGRVLTYADVEADEQIALNEMIVALEHATLGTVRVQGSPYWLDGEKARLEIAAPPLGHHTDSVRAAMAGSSGWPAAKSSS